GRARGRCARGERVPLGRDQHRGAESVSRRRRHRRAAGDGRRAMSDLTFLSRLQQIIEQRVATAPAGSYTAELAAQGPLKVAQKVGEEGVELALAAVAQDEGRVTAEAADLVYHLLLLLTLRKLSIDDVVAELKRRHR